MDAIDGAGWSGVGWNDWSDLASIRARLEAGASPDWRGEYEEPPLHAAAEDGSPQVIAELARRVSDIDAEFEGRTALWAAVFANRPDNARALVAAGADPHRPMMSGWSPARLSLATPHPDLFGAHPGEITLTAAENDAVAEARRLIAALGEFDYDGMGLACVAGITAAEAVRRLGAAPLPADEAEELMEDPWSAEDDSLLTVAVTDVPGGCVVSQPFGYAPSTPVVMKLLSEGTVAYGMYANPKSGNQGCVARGGELEEWDTHPGGGGVDADEPTEEILAAYLYHGEAIAYCCAGAGLRLTDARAFTGTPDLWVKLPQMDLWK